MLGRAQYSVCSLLTIVTAISYSCIAPLVLGFATVGFTLLYLAYRYNVLFTLGTNVDTQGRAYARALEHLTVGIYLSEVCLIGLFAINSGSSLLSLIPMILMIVFLVATVIWHGQLRQMFYKHTICLPSDLIADEYESSSTDSREKTRSPSGRPLEDLESGDSSISRHKGESRMPLAAQAPKRRSGLLGTIERFLLPAKLETAAAISKHVLSPHLAEPVPAYSQQEHDEAYMRPCVTTPAPVIWIARDQFGFSRKEVAATSRQVGEGLDATDEFAWFDEKGKVQWDEMELRKAPLWEDEPIY